MIKWQKARWKQTMARERDLYFAPLGVRGIRKINVLIYSKVCIQIQAIEQARLEGYRTAGVIMVKSRSKNLVCSYYYTLCKNNKSDEHLVVVFFVFGHSKWTTAICFGFNNAFRLLKMLCSPHSRSTGEQMTWRNNAVTNKTITNHH